jgi:MFS family permease
MYQVSNSTAFLKAHRRLLATDRTAAVPRTVVLLGICSLLTDISSEMVVTILPLYLISVGGFSPLAFGVVDGIYNGAAALVGLASGLLGDRLRRHKEVAASGYGLSAICKLLLATIGTAVSAIGTVVLLDRIGKGIRTAPRDAMISLSTPKEQLGASFGVHRALDTTGAMIGPLVAFLILAAAPLAFNSIFLVSFFIAILGVAIIVLFVNAPALRPGGDDDAEAPTTPSLAAAGALLKVPRFRALLVAAAVLSLATASDAFLFLALQRKLDLGNSLFPLLFVGSSLTFMVLAVPMGRIADRFGRGRVMLGGYAVLLSTYAVVLQPLGGWVVLAAGLGLLGTYYAATDGVIMALASSVVPDEVRGSGLALVGTVTNIARLVASIVFGSLWTLWGIHDALAAFGLALCAAIVLAAFVLHRTRAVVAV